MEKINIAELLRDCPKGMELDCTTWENVTFEKAVNDAIYIKRNNKAPSFNKIAILNQYGCITNHQDEKCRIFPKGKNTWEGFVPPINFNDGDVVYCKDEIKGNQLFIIKEYRGNDMALCYLFLDNDGTLDTDVCVYNIDGLATEEEKQKLFDAIKANGYRWNAETKTLEKLPIFNDGDIIYNRFHQVIGIYHFKEDESHCVRHCRYNEYHKTFEILNEDLYIAKQDYRLASKEEKQKFFDVIKANGYNWNPETKTLEKLTEPKFKVGNRVKHISTHTSGMVLKVGDKGYYIDYYKDGGVRYISFLLEKDYELVPNKFDINTLVPFESKVLVRDSEDLAWRPAIFGLYKPQIEKDFPFIVVGGTFYRYCIPYEGNEHLLGTTNDCDDFIPRNNTTLKPKSVKCLNR